MSKAPSMTAPASATHAGCAPCHDCVWPRSGQRLSQLQRSGALYHGSRILLGRGAPGPLAVYSIAAVGVVQLFTAGLSEPLHLAQLWLCLMPIDTPECLLLSMKGSNEPLLPVFCMPHLHAPCPSFPSCPCLSLPVCSCQPPCLPLCQAPFRWLLFAMLSSSCQLL